jgi:heme-degrading monooxygenase HmoA
MHAVVVKAIINDVEASESYLREEGAARVSQLPGFVSGYWTRNEDRGLSMIVFESEDAATSFRDMVQSIAPPTVTIEDAEVREVVAHA